MEICLFKFITTKGFIVAQMQRGDQLETNK